MPNNKKDPQSGSKSSMGNQPDRQFESQGKKKDFGEQEKLARKGKEGGLPETMDDDELNTAGGRQGQFSDKDRGNEAQWSPGSKRPLDE